MMTRNDVTSRKTQQLEISSAPCRVRLDRQRTILPEVDREWVLVTAAAAAASV